VYKSTLSRAIRREIVKRIKDAAKAASNPTLRGGICFYINNQNVPSSVYHRADLRHAIQHTLGDDHTFLPTAVLNEKQQKDDTLRDAVRSKFLREYSEKGVAYSAVEWVTRFNEEYKTWKKEIDKIAAKCLLTPKENPSLEEQATWVDHFMNGLHPRNAWNKTPWN